MNAKHGFQVLINVLLGFLFVSVANHYFGVAMEGDVGCFDAVSHQMKLGQRLYKDVFDNKAPGIFYLNWILPYRGFSQITSSWAIQVSSFFVLVVSMRPLLLRWTLSNPLYGVCASIFVVFSFRTIVFFWPAFFVGGYTEQIGSYLLISGFLILFQTSFLGTDIPQSDLRILKCKLFASGFLIGLTTLIKEPFIFFVPAMILWLFFINRKGVKTWFLGLMVPWVMHALILFWSGSCQDYIQYLKFAMNYGIAGGSILEAQKWIDILIPFRFDSLPVVNISQLFVFFGFIVLLFFQLSPANADQRNAKTVEMTKTVVVLVTYLLLLWASRGFGHLGKGNYYHYQIPEYLITWFGLVLLLHSISSYLQQSKSTNMSNSRLLLVVTLSLLYLSNALVKGQMPIGHSNMLQTLRNPHFINGAYYPELPKVTNEEYAWRQFVNAKNIHIPEKAKIFVDDPHLGRFYGYLNSQYTTFFPCPYWVYFHKDSMLPNDPIRSVLEQNRNTIIRQLQDMPPQFILMGENKGPFATFNELINYFENNFIKRGEFFLGKKKVMLYEKVSPEHLDDNQ